MAVNYHCRCHVVNNKTYLFSRSIVSLEKSMHNVAVLLTVESLLSDKAIIPASSTTFVLDLGCTTNKLRKSLK